MFIKNNKKEKNRYSGYDVRDWKVVTFEGKEIHVKNTVTNESGEKETILITRWNGFKTANAVAKRNNGVAVRA